VNGKVTGWRVGVVWSLLLALDRLVDICIGRVAGAGV